MRKCFSPTLSEIRTISRQSKGRSWTLRLSVTMSSVGFCSLCTSYPAGVEYDCFLLALRSSGTSDRRNENGSTLFCVCPLHGVGRGRSLNNMKNKNAKREGPISTGFLTHFTSFESLLKILKEKKLLVQFAKEPLDVLQPGIQPIVPRVCFTDLPLENARILREKRYGECGIAFSKDFASSRGISPVIYLRKNGRLTGIIKGVLDKIEEEERKYLLAFLKPYYGNKKGIISQEMERSYDDREWRYVPEIWEEKKEGDYFKEPLPFKYEEIYQIIVTSVEELGKIESEFPALKGKVVIK